MCGALGVSLARSLDRALLGGALHRLRDTLRHDAERRRLARENPYRAEIFYSKDARSDLSGLFDRYGSDKGALIADGHPYPGAPHTFADFYEMLFFHRRNAIRTIVECGIGTNNPGLPSNMGVDGKPGASLRAWRDYFPNARVVGLDIDPDILFREDRIETYACDQTSPASIRRFREEAGLRAGSVDIVIDDGLHTFDAGRCLLDNTIDLLADGGVYVIEDVAKTDRRAFGRYLAGRDELDARIVNLHRPGLALGNNALVVVTRRWRVVQAASG